MNFPTRSIQTTAQILLLIATAFPVVAQTTQQQTNWRVCDGKLYNASRDTAWLQLKGTVSVKLTNGLILRQLIEQEYEAIDSSSIAPSDGLNSIGGFSANAGPYKVRRKRDVPGQLIFLRNYSVAAKAKIPNRVEVKAMRAGKFEFNGELVDAWDCGRLPTPAEMRDPNVTGRASAMNETEWLAFEKKRAEEGNKFSQFRLGLRYLKGDGVETNKAEGERWIRAAAAQGLGEAKEKLKALEP